MKEIPAFGEGKKMDRQKDVRHGGIHLFVCPSFCLHLMAALL